MNLLDWAQIALSLVVMLAGLYLSSASSEKVVCDEL
jgi:hypothetical protein